MTNIIKFFIGNSILLAVYYITAHFTLSLGLPPAGATPVWVPAGLSLAAVLIWGYRLLPAIFIGDFIIGVELVGLNDTTSIIICILIGAQAMGHAWLATWLLYRFKLWPTLLIKESNIIKFFLISAGISLLLVTFLFAIAELALGVLAPNEFLKVLFTWWAGGAIGVVIFTPLVLILFAKPRQEWNRRLYSVASPLILLFVLLIGILFFLRDYEEKIRHDKFDENITVVHETIENELLKNQLLLKAMRAYFKNSSDVSAIQFSGYMNDLSDYQGSIKGAAWVDYIPHHERYDYEQERGRKIVEINAKGVPLVANNRDHYLVKKYSQISNNYLKKLDKHSVLNLFDLCFTPERAAICNKTIRTKQPMILPPVLDHFEDSQRFVFILPVMLKNDVMGLVAHMYEYQSLFNVISQSVSTSWLNLTITDITNNKNSHVLFDSQDNSQAVNLIDEIPLLKVKTIEIGGRIWQLQYQPSQKFVATYSNWSLYWIMTSALIILSLIIVFLLAMTGRIRQVNLDVDEKTRQIRQNSKLLADSEEKYRNLVENVNGEYFIYQHDVDGVFTYVSPSIESILGYSSNAFLKHYFTYMPDTKINNQVERHTKETLEGAESQSYELEIFHKSGQLKILKVMETATYDDNGNVLGVHGLARDITKSKKEHLELEKLSLAVQHSPNAIIITDSNGVIEYVNPQFSIITGYTSLDVLGKKPNILKSGLMPDTIFEDLWNTLLLGKEWRGEVHNRKKNGDLYWAQEHICPLFDDDNKVSHFIATQEDVTEARELNENTSYQASHDLLTGLINRREFELRLDRIIKSVKDDHAEHALCFMDLDQFKIVNDTCGHVAGDELLRQIGDLLQANVRQRDTLARLGGDEFSLLMEHCGIEQAYDACQKIINVLANFRFHWEEHIFTIGISIGLAQINKHIQDSHEILGHVDGACYAAKDAGRNRVEVHTEDSARLKKRKGEIQWNNEINEALDTNRFELYCQPIVALQDSDIGISYEVLLRLRMPDNTVIPPGAFLPAAERYNSITRIDRWVIEHTLRWISTHADQLNHIKSLSINLSGQSLGDEAMLGFIIKTFQQGDVPAEKIKFEITETAAIANLRDATVFMKTLSELGCRFALDDFGSGLSSFAYLKNLKVDVLKIDGMFVKDMLEDPIDFEMVKSINDIGHVMGLETIAEFVENDEIADKLREIGVDYAQGYTFGYPMPIDTILSDKS